MCCINNMVYNNNQIVMNTTQTTKTNTMLKNTQISILNEKVFKNAIFSVFAVGNMIIIYHIYREK